MCQFFSCVSDGKGKVYYFNADLRREVREGKLNYEPDSHTSIADYFGFKGAEEDLLNKYEYSPLTKKFIVDRLNTKDDSKQVKEFCQNLDFADIVPELVIKSIFHPFSKIRERVTQTEIELLREWASVGASVWASVGDSVRASVWASVWASVRAYTSSFFSGIEKWKYIEHEKGKNPFQCCIDLWEIGLVPSFDGERWRLHTGPDGKVIYDERKIEEL